MTVTSAMANKEWWSSLCCSSKNAIDEGRRRRRMSSMLRPVENAIREKLTARLTPAHVEVVNESHMHNVPEDAETHFKVLIVSHEFDGLPLLRRHRLVNEILSHELRHGIHALSIITKTPDQWTDGGATPVEPSPPCRGGFGK